MTPFIPPCLPTLRPTPPAGNLWLHEIKFDGWRLQLHKSGRDARLFSKNGHDYTQRFPAIATALQALYPRACILDGELVACDTKDRPDFRALHERSAGQHELCVWIFDILHLNGRDLRARPLEHRKQRLERLMARAANHLLRHSETFDDPIALLNAADRQELEGIVSKRRASSYRSGPSRDWIKVKTAAWREANRERWKLFDKSKNRRR